MRPSLLLWLALLLSTSSASSLRPRSSPLEDGAISIDSLTRHTEQWEGDDVELRCVVALDAEDTPHRVEWIFVPAAEDDVESSPVEHGRSERRQRKTYQSDVVASDGDGGGDDSLVALAADDEVLLHENSRFFDGGRRLRVSVRRRWDAVDDDNLEEHFLRITNLSTADQGMYVCQVKASAASRLPLAYRHCVLSVHPAHLRQEAERARTPRRRNSRTGDADPTHAAPLTKSSELTEDGAAEERPTLGPVTERFHVATRGQDVVFECRDADDNWVYWRKQGDPSVLGEGRQLRLFRVDRWDSGIYYCSTNTSLANEGLYNVTLRVEHPPRVSIALGAAVAQAEGHPATLTCRVEGVPVPRIAWYRVFPSPSTDTVLPHPSSAPSSPVSAVVKQAVHNADDLALAIGGFKDGLVESSIKIPAVGAKHYGTYRCEAKNSQGEDMAEIKLERSHRPVDFEELLRRIQSEGNQQEGEDQSHKSYQEGGSSAGAAIQYQRISIAVASFLAGLALFVA